MRTLRVFLGVVLAVALFATACGKKDPAVHTFQMGEKVTMGHLIYTVFETEWLTQLGNPPEGRIPQNRFLLVRVSVMNSGSQDLTVPNFYLEDDKGADYQELDNGAGVPQWIGAIRTTPPAEPVQGNVVFDCPPGHYKLHIADENNDHPAFIDIPLTFNSDSPDVPLPSGKKE